MSKETLKDLFTENNKSNLLYKNNILENIKVSFINNVQNKIASPLNNGNLNKVLKEIHHKSIIGHDHLLYRNYQNQFGDKKDDSNILIPYLDYSNQKNIFIRELVIISDHNDAERIAKIHLKKMPNFKGLLYDSIISTTDDDHWRSQRKSFIGAFDPFSSLEKILPISDGRARKCSDILIGLSNGGKKEVNINDFFLNETQAQLQLALFGLSNEFQEETNSKIRDAFSGDGQIGYARDFAFKLIDELENSNGPLSQAIKERGKVEIEEAYGNALIFAFAGHDTTGHTLTWLIYELSKNMKLQLELQKEVDNFWLEQGSKKIKLDDFKRLKFMTRCIMEILRLWPAVPNGTFRELVFDDEIMGLNDQKVQLKKGTFVQILNWSRHRNKELWGRDADTFNPNRQFEENEIWDDQGFAGFNPGTKRFSPFTYPPRDCLGKNFAQIEMRLILLHLLKKFSFILTDNQAKHVSNNEEKLGINRATLAPINVNDTKYNKNNKGLRPFQIGMFVIPIPRNKISKL
jgi:cytochrome P450